MRKIFSSFFFFDVGKNFFHFLIGGMEEKRVSEKFPQRSARGENFSLLFLECGKAFKTKEMLHREEIM
jgi:hypothetical protein